MQRDGFLTASLTIANQNMTAAGEDPALSEVRNSDGP